MFSGSGMAAGRWLAGAIHDDVGFYAVAFPTGIVINFVYIAVIGAVVLRQTRCRTAGWAAGRHQEA